MSRANRVGSFLALAVPMIVSRAGLAGMGIADGLMVARYGAGELAVQGLSEGTLGRLIDVLAAFLAAGIVLAAQTRAAGRPDQAGAIWRHAMTLAVVLGAGAAAAGIAGWWLLLQAGGFGEPRGLAEAAFPVITALGISAPAALVALVSGMYLEAVGRAKTVAIAIVAANLANIGGNALLIPALGALGSALSTGLVRVMLAGALVACVWRTDTAGTLGIRHSGAGTWRDFAVQRRLGYGAAGTAAVMNFIAMGVTLLAGWIGVMPLAAITALWNALSAGMLLALGMADATAIRVAGSHGRGAGALANGALGLAITLVTLVVLGLFVALSPGAVAAFYAPTGALGPALAALLPLGAAILVCDGVVIVAAASLRGIGDVARPTFIQIGTGLCLLPLAWWLAIGLGGGVTALLQAILLVSALRAALLTLRFVSQTGGSLSPQAT